MKKAVLLLCLTTTLILTSCLKDDSINFDDQLASDILLIDNYLAENGIDATEHESGLRYVIEDEGVGEVVMEGSNLHAKFIGKFFSSETFVSNIDGISFRFDAQLIEAWRIAIPLISEGGKITIYAPSVYCFGPDGLGSVGPNTSLIYEIELVDLDVTEEDQLGFDSELIDKYLSDNEIETLEHESGIRYTVTEEGSGDSPSGNDVVNVKYEGRLLTDEVFDSNSSGISFVLSQLIPAWRTMIPLMKEGGKLTIYAQSGYCYGEGGTGTIPPNAPLIFDIELVEIE